MAFADLNVVLHHWYTDIISITGHDFNNYDIYKLDLNNNLERLTETPFNESFPQYSPDRNKIAFISDESGINNIYITEDNFQSYYNFTIITHLLSFLNLRLRSSWRALPSSKRCFSTSVSGVTIGTLWGLPLSFKETKVR